MTEDQQSEEISFEKMLIDNKRGAQDYWYWRDKTTMELGASREVLAEAGFSFSDMFSREPGDDPPDCEGILDGRRCGIEVSELVHEKTLKASIKGNHQYFVWKQEDFVDKLQKLISRKDVPHKVKGGPYSQYFLVLLTDEFTLGRGDVERFLEGQTFAASMITDVLLGLSYDPSVKKCPVFRLHLSK
jgi:hypothetical protein